MASQSPQSSRLSTPRLLPQPIDMSTKKVRRLLPEPVEIAARSSRAWPAKERNPDAGGSGLRKPATPFVEASTVRKRGVHPETPPIDAVKSTNPTTLTSILPQPTDTTPTAPKPRKFAPQLVETTRRRRRSTDTHPAVLPSDKTEVSPEDPPIGPRSLTPVRPSPLLIAPVNTPVLGAQGVAGLSESKFSSLNLRKNETRRRSFRVPDLPSILSAGDSEGSNESDCPSLSTSPSAASDETGLSKLGRWARNSDDENSSGDLLVHAARAAEKELREQAMAAYPNEKVHEPVDHFAVDRDSEESNDDVDVGHHSADTPKASRDDCRVLRGPSGVGWHASDVRIHLETLEKQHKKPKTTAQPELDRRRSKKGSCRISVPSVKNPPQITNAAKHHHEGRHRDAEWEKMRNAASPPMAGQKLQFPLCPSPQPTRLEVGQHPSACKGAEAVTPKGHTGLWTPGGGVSKQGSDCGLWMGTSAKPAQANLEASAQLQSGLLTPAAEADDPFISSPSSYGTDVLPPSPPPYSQSDPRISGLDSILHTEQKIALEFHDAFVTQVYNYLSLGYPSLARKYDAELSKISKISVDELRQDDSLANAKGYVGAPEGGGSDIRRVQQGTCARWSALRKYVREWARQQSHMRHQISGQNGEWGDRARRGSWAV